MRLKQALTSSILSKMIVAITGLAMIGFLVAHLLGNLQVFAGQDAIDSYAVKLRHYPQLLWTFRIGLLAAVALHIGYAVNLKLENLAARPTPYTRRQYLRATLTSRTMIWTGLLVAAYIVYHLMHFTWHETNPAISHYVDAAGRHDVFNMIVLSFQNPLITGIYVLSVVLLTFHLWHGIPSLFQTFGLNNKRTERVVNIVGPIIALVFAVGFIAIPVAVYIGWVVPAMPLLGGH